MVNKKSKINTKLKNKITRIKKTKSRVISKKPESRIFHNNKKSDGIVNSYKNQIIGLDEEEKKYTEMFEQRLAEQYKEFRSVKDHTAQIKKFTRMLLIIITIILISLLILTYSG